MNEDMMTMAERNPIAIADAVSTMSTTDNAVDDGNSNGITRTARGTYMVHTLGCQMNVHDSERIAGILEDHGYTAATAAQRDSKDVDVIVLNTCAVRENAAERMYGTLGLWAQYKRRNPHMQIAVGGCMAQLDRDRIAQRAPWVDAVFGTKSIGALPHLLDEARLSGQAQVVLFAGGVGIVPLLVGPLFISPKFPAP